MICPYTGLRSFSEDESLYFKGRDLQIDQITALLEKNKFLMVTGASGEGKSSLIYAGLIPNARSGFFKSKYTNWVVADFRPERSPVRNMAKSIAEKFQSNEASIETELRRGFSSLIDLYTNSDFYIDEHDQRWIESTEQERKDKKRKAANLIILVDQFEEFFTNPENFYNDAPSVDSQIVVNLILETGRIAIQKNLPVYVVCTMRSDYIGQCSAFRGLPEYIGFSQFFVPRLKRKDLKQVVEEPAILSGNRISQRLIERLVYDLSEGVDQLPILQHALNQIWLAADHGNEEMDLIHYAMVGGMPAEDLPEQDQAKFNSWFSSLPDQQQNYYKQTGLNKVIEIHASLLYENAWTYYNKKNPGNPITKHDSKRIIALSFCCLTKIDNSRAVRNRMSLTEIAEIINSREISPEVVGNVLDIYREEGNSFMRPLKTDDQATHKLSPDVVLDITHESLIRNWDKLNEWANQEFEFYTTYLDFRKQLDRWKANKKSAGYLMPIGPLTYFENWYDTCKPNVGWIKRYSQKEEEKGAEHKVATEVLTDIREYLKKSANNIFFTRTVMKYGPSRLVAIFAVIVMFILSGFYWIDARQKENNAVVQKIREKAKSLLVSKEIATEEKGIYLLTEERYNQGTLIPLLDELPADNRLGVAIKAYRQVLVMDKHSEYPIKSELIKYIRSYFERTENHNSDYELLLDQLNEFVILLSYDHYYNPNEDTRKLIEEISEKSYQTVFAIFSDKLDVRPTFPIEINIALQWWLAFGDVTPGKVQKILDLISPLQNEAKESSFSKYYAKGGEEPNGRLPNINNGGYHTLASLFATLGDTESVLWCFNQIRDNGQKEYFGTGRQLNNYNNIIGYFYQYGHRTKVEPILRWLSLNDQADREISVYRNVIIRASHLSRYFPNNINEGYLRTYRGNFFPNLCMAEENVLMMLAEDYVKEIQKIDNINERNYLMAMHYKRMAMHRHKYYFDRGLSADMNVLNGWLDKSIEYYRLIDIGYLNEITEITYPYYSDGVRTKKLSRKHLLIYPDYMDGWFSSTYHTDLYFNYLVNKNLLLELFTSTEELELITYWIAKAHEFKLPSFFPPPYFDNFYRLSDEVLAKVTSFITNHTRGGAVDLNYLYVIMANREFAKGDTINGLQLARKLNLEQLSRSANRYEYIEKSFFLNRVKELSGHLAAIGNTAFALQLAESYEEDYQKLFCYVYMAEASYLNQNPQFFTYLDSAMSLTKSIDFSALPFQWDARYNLMSLLAKIGGEQMNSMAYEIFRDIPEGPKFFGILRMADGMAAEGNFYRAFTIIPSTLTEEQDLISCVIILWEACKKNEHETDSKKWIAMDYILNGDWNERIYFRPF